MFDPPGPTETRRRPAAPAARPVARRLASGRTSGVEVPQRVALPPGQKYSRLRVWLGLLLTVAVCLPPLLVSLPVADVTGGEEASLLLRSRETWQRHHAGEPMAYMVPTANGQQVLSEPPMAVWLHGLGWAGLDPATTSAETLLHRARLMSAAMAILAVLATYWAGLSVGGASVAWLAALALGSSVLFIYQGRLATSDSFLLAFVTLSMASALWAMRPLKPTAWVGRRVFGWLISGVTLGGAILTTGLTATIFVLPPLIAAICLTPLRRVGNTIGLLFAVILGVIVAAPWYLYVLDSNNVPDAWDRLVAHAHLPEHLFVLTWSHGRALMTFFPWVVFLIGALCQPFLRADRERRRQLLIAWSWFALGFVALSLPAAEHPRYLTPILPAVALMVGQLWAFHARLAEKQRHDPGVNWLRAPHWLMLMGVSVVGGIFVLSQESLMAGGYLRNIELALLPGWGVVLWAAGLLVIALVGAAMHFSWRPTHAAYATVAWMLLAATVGFHAHAMAPQRQNPYVPEAGELRMSVADGELMYLHGGEDAQPLNDAFLFYVGRTAPPVARMQLKQLLEQEKRVYVAADRGGGSEQALQLRGFRYIGSFHDGSRPRVLYRNERGAAVTAVFDGGS